LLIRENNRGESMRVFIRAVALAATLLAAAPATPAEIKVLGYNAVNVPARELAAAFSKETGHQVIFTFGSPGPVNERLKTGETFDLVIMAGLQEVVWVN
jgi:molybdate transport system substrate-binding protein